MKQQSMDRDIGGMFDEIDESGESESYVQIRNTRADLNSILDAFTGDEDEYS